MTQNIFRLRPTQPSQDEVRNQLRVIAAFVVGQHIFNPSHLSGVRPYFMATDSSSVRQSSDLAFQLAPQVRCRHVAHGIGTHRMHILRKELFNHRRHILC